MLGARVASAVVLIPVVLFMLWFSPETTTLLAAIAAVLGTSEFYNMAIRSRFHYHPLFLPGFVLAAFLAYAAYLPANSLLLMLIAVGLFTLVAAVTIWLRDKTMPDLNPTKNRSLWNWILSVFPPVYVGLPLALLVLMRIQAGNNGIGWIALALLGTWGTDTAAYFVGRAFGKHKLAPAISPKKTVEGAIGGIVFGIVGTVVVGQFLLNPPLPLYFSVPLGVGVAIVSILGDLFESWVKRRFDTKDSGKLIPGHGGLLDRIDGFLAVSLLVFIFFEFYPLVSH